MTLYAWTVSGERYHEGSSDPWRIETADGVIEAECAGEALEKIVNGVGEPLENTIPWDLIDQEREITITIRPADDKEGE